jgi:hypothetical protein
MCVYLVFTRTQSVVVYCVLVQWMFFMDLFMIFDSIWLKVSHSNQSRYVNTTM